MADKNTETIEKGEETPVEEKNKISPNENGTKIEGEKISLTQDELDAKIAEAVITARKETATTEKNKLYKNSEKQKTEIKDLNTKLFEYESKENEATAKVEKERLDKLSDDDRRDEQYKTQEEKIAKLTGAFDLLQKETDNKLEKKDLELHREKLLTTADGKVIPEMVAGKTKEEIELSFEKAKDRYESIVQIEIARHTKEKPETQPAVSTETPLQTKTPSSASQGDAMNLEDIMKMPKDEFDNYSEKRLKELGFG